MIGMDLVVVAAMDVIFGGGERYWEIGADPEAIKKLIKKHCNNLAELKVLDLGCGKGAVSVKLSQEFGCISHGIDAIPEFVEFARQKASELKVNHLCKFETGDIREKVKELSGYDIAILGAIGPIFGDYFSTLSTREYADFPENGKHIWRLLLNSFNPGNMYK